MSRAEKYIVQTLFDEHTQSSVWDASQPLVIGHPMRWVLERTDQGMRLRQLGLSKGSPIKGMIKNITHYDIRDERDVVLPGLDTGEQDAPRAIRVLQPQWVRPAFSYSNAPVYSSENYWCVYEMLNEWVVSSQILHFESGYVGYDGKNAAFSIRKRSGEVEIKVLNGTLILELGDGRSQTGSRKDRWRLHDAQLGNIVIRRGERMWRFNQVHHLENPAWIGQPRALPDEQRFYKRLATSLVSLLVVSLIAVHWITLPEQQLIPSDSPGLVETETKIIMPMPPMKKEPPKTEMAVSPRPDPSREAQEKNPLVPEKRLTIKPSPKVKPRPVKLGEMPKSPPVRLPPAIDIPIPIEKSVPGAPVDMTQLTKNVDVLAPPISDPTSQKVAVKMLGSPKGTPDAQLGYDSGAGIPIRQQGGGLIAVDSGGSEVEEGLTKDEVARVVRAHMNEIRSCYESASGSAPIEGKLQLAFAITGAGRVQSVTKQGGDINNSELENCLSSKVKNWAFPKPRGGATVKVSYPFVFRTLGRR